MTNNSFEKIREDNRLLYEYIRGSYLYNLQMEDGSSDIDTSAVFIAPHDSLLGIGLGYQDQISDTKHDNTWYELGNFCKLLLKSNPTILESLFVPKDKMLVPPSEIMIPLFENKEQFITKKCFNPFVGYAIEQIKKARGLNKKIVNPVTERLTPFDFAYTFYKQGSTKVKNWLENRGLDKDCCGLVHIPNMHDTYGVYYDWGAHFKKQGIKTIEDLRKTPLFFDFIYTFYGLNDDMYTDVCAEWFEKNKEVKHYRGMCLENATNMRGSSVSKGEKPILYMVYNESGFKKHCQMYKEYQDWVKNRNPKRYESNLNKNYDSKNMCHTLRLLHMGREIAEGRGIILERTEDREFLMNVRNHKYEYDELIEIVMKDKESLDNAIANSTIKESIDINFVNDLLIEMRKKAYNL